MSKHPDEVLFPELFPFQRLDIYRVARRLVVVVEGARVKDRELRDQASRAAKSTLLRLAEGLPQTGAGLRRKYFDESRGSLHELVAALDVAAALGSVEPETAREAMQLAYRLRGMLLKLR
jgi:four helix bundle protein